MYCLTDRVSNLCVTLTPPQVVAEADLVVLEALQELGELVADDTNLVVVDMEAPVGFET